MIISQIWYVILANFWNLKYHLIPNMLIPHLSSLVKQFKRGNYCYANAPKIKICSKF